MSAGETNSRWTGIERPYGRDEIERIRGRFHIEHTLARLGAERLWELLHSEGYVGALGATPDVEFSADYCGRHRNRTDIRKNTMDNAALPNSRVCARLGSGSCLITTRQTA